MNTFRQDLEAARLPQRLIAVPRSQVEFVYHLLDLLPAHVRREYVDDEGVLWAEVG